MRERKERAGGRGDDGEREREGRREKGGSEGVIARYGGEGERER